MTNYFLLIHSEKTKTIFLSFKRFYGKEGGKIVWKKDAYMSDPQQNQ